MSSQFASNIVANTETVEIRSKVRPSTGVKQETSRHETNKNETSRPVTVGSTDVVRPTSGAGATLQEKRENGKSGHVGRRRNGAERTSAAWAVKSQVTCDRLKSLKIVVEKAISEHKTFSVIGAFPSIRDALRQRGWIEKSVPPRPRRRKITPVNPSTPVGMDDDDDGMTALQACDHDDANACNDRTSACDDSTNACGVDLTSIVCGNDVTLSACDDDDDMAPDACYDDDMASSAKANDDYSMSMSAQYSLAQPSAQPSPNKSDITLMARLLKHTPVDFFWSMRSDTIEWRELTKKQMVNRFPRAYFTTKVGLCSYLQQMHWYCEMGVSQILFPRCYNIGQGDELLAFKKDYYQTACIALLTWLVTRYETGGEKAVKATEGRIPPSVVDFAIERCNEFISTQTHEDIDMDEVKIVWEHHWDQFLRCFYMIVNGNNLLTEVNDGEAFKELIVKAKNTLHNMKRHWPQLSLDGTLNIWIVKPGNKSRGRGIQLMNRLDEILAKVNPAISKETRYVVQKYIEHPLLIHNTKFDIRQWFLVTSAHPLTIWMYKDSYLRFCSQSFNLRNMHESVHLCNNAVQCRYKNGKRDGTDLPDENMWDCHTFKTYLRGIGHSNMWDDLIYPGMREAIVGTLLASQEHMDRRQNCFELFGADFMLTEDFSPWLIEINSCPCMAPSTSVTARLCAECLEDVIKVVVDRRTDKNASTGMFELVYKQQIPPAPPYLGMSLAVRGQKILKAHPHKKKTNKKDMSPDRESVGSSHAETKKKLKRQVGPIIVDLIEDLARHLEKASRRVDASTLRHNDKYRDPTRILDRVNNRFQANLDKQERCKQSENTVPKKKTKIIKKLNKGTHKKSKKLKKQNVDDCEQDISLEESDELSKEVSQSSEEEIQDLDQESNLAPDTLEGNKPKTDLTWINSRLNVEHLENNNQGVNKQQDSAVPQRSHSTGRMPTPITDWTNEHFTTELFGTTKTSCEDLLARLKLINGNDGIDLKPKYNSAVQGIDWDSELNSKPSISDIVTKLSENQSDREYFMTSNGQGLMDSLPGVFSESKLKSHDDIRKLPSYLNVMLSNGYPPNRTDKVSKLSGQRIGLRVNPPVYSSVLDKNGPLRPGLPIIRQKSKQHTANDFHSTRSMENFYAVGMSLQGIHSGVNRKENLIMPLGTVPSLEVNGTSSNTTTG